MKDNSRENIDLNQSKLRLNGVYTLTCFQNVHIVEFEAMERINDLEITEITQEIEGENRMNWQVPYDEKYLNASNKVIGGWMDEPKSIKEGHKIVFFFHELDKEKTIKTQYGDYEINEIKESPKWISEIMNYEEP